MISKKLNVVWIFSLLCLAVFSTDGFAAGKVKAKVISSSGDCESCTAKKAAGGPLDGNKSAQFLAQVSDSAATSDDKIFYNYLFLYCGVLTDLEDGEWEFKKKLIDPMISTSSDKKIDRYWTEPGCEPNYIGGTMSPMIHKIAENSTDRKQFIVMLQKMYANDPVTFRKILNAKNTQGQTVLDYIQYVYSNKKFIKDEEAGLNNFVQYLCANGATYSVYNKKCPAEHITL